jgi:hypothetical protein
MINRLDDFYSRKIARDIYKSSTAVLQKVRRRQNQFGLKIWQRIFRLIGNRIVSGFQEVYSRDLAI